MSDRRDPWSVGAWMTPNPATIAPDTPVRAAFYTMRARGFRHLLVTDGERLQGIVTDRDLRRPDLTEDPDGWNDYYRLDEDFLVRDVMTAAPQTAKPRDRIERALTAMLEGKFGALPVVDKNDRLIGILTTADMMRAFHTALIEVGDRLRRS